MVQFLKKFLVTTFLPYAQKNHNMLVVLQRPIIFVHEVIYMSLIENSTPGIFCRSLCSFRVESDRK